MILKNLQKIRVYIKPAEILYLYTKEIRLIETISQGERSGPPRRGSDNYFCASLLRSIAISLVSSSPCGRPFFRLTHAHTYIYVRIFLNPRKWWRRPTARTRACRKRWLRFIMSTVEDSDPSFGGSSFVFAIVKFGRPAIDVLEQQIGKECSTPRCIERELNESDLKRGDQYKFRPRRRDVFPACNIRS